MVPSIPVFPHGLTPSACLGQRGPANARRTWIRVKRRPFSVLKYADSRSPMFCSRPASWCHHSCLQGGSYCGYSGLSEQIWLIFAKWVGTPRCPSGVSPLLPLYINWMPDICSFNSACYRSILTLTRVCAFTFVFPPPPQPPPPHTHTFCESNALVRATVCVVYAIFGSMSYLAFYEYPPLSEQHSLLFPSIL